MAHIIFSITHTVSRIVSESPIAKELTKHSLEFRTAKSIHPPFNFDHSSVFALIADTRQKIGEKEMKYFPNLKVISPFGIGYDHIDLDAAKKRNIIVTNVPEVHKESVAELAFAFMLSCARKLPAFHADMKKDKWNPVRAINLSGKTLGIVGLGNIGKSLAKFGRAFGMTICAHDVQYDGKFIKRYNVEKASFRNVLHKSDFVVLSLPLTPKTHHLINKTSIGHMQKHAYLINIARGGIVEDKALLDALKKETIAGAGLDVYSEEPPFKNPVLRRIINHPHVITTPHIAPATPSVDYQKTLRLCNNFLSVCRGNLKGIDRVA